MTSYTVDWCEEVTSSKGTVYKKATLTDDNGQNFEGVAIFKTFENYDKVVPSAVLEGILKTKNFKGKASYNLDNPMSSGQTSERPHPSRPSTISRAVERKEKTIGQAMDRKEVGIKLSSTFRDATLIVTALMGSTPTPPTRDWIESEWKRWRDWLWVQYDSPDSTSQPPF